MVFKRQPAAAGKSATNLSWRRSAMMAGLIQAPQRYSPFVNMKLAKHQQEVVLSHGNSGWITLAEEAGTRGKNQTWRIKSFPGSAGPYV